MRTVILCGGKGTRAHPYTLELPKPLLDVGDRPILAHLMEIFAGQGFNDFVLAGGYKLHCLEEFARAAPPEWNIEVADTGEDTNTGGRVARCADRVGGALFAYRHRGFWKSMDTYKDALDLTDLCTGRSGPWLDVPVSPPLPSSG